jgi:phosphoribosylformylglycinamidine (FGAM) synthase-like enzyme
MNLDTSGRKPSLLEQQHLETLPSRHCSSKLTFAIVHTTQAHLEGRQIKHCDQDDCDNIRIRMKKK